MRPVPPPTTAIGEWPQRCRCASAIIGSRFPTCRLERGGIEADVAGDLLAREQRPRAFGGVVHEAAPLQFAVEVHQSLL